MSLFNLPNLALERRLIEVAEVREIADVPDQILKEMKWEDDLIFVVLKATRVSKDKKFYFLTPKNHLSTLGSTFGNYMQFSRRDNFGDYTKVCSVDAQVSIIDNAQLGTLADLLIEDFKEIEKEVTDNTIALLWEETGYYANWEGRNAILAKLYELIDLEEKAIDAQYRRQIDEQLYAITRQSLISYINENGLRELLFGTGDPHFKPPRPAKEIQDKVKSIDREVLFRALGAAVHDPVEGIRETVLQAKLVLLNYGVNLFDTNVKRDPDPESSRWQPDLPVWV